MTTAALLLLLSFTSLRGQELTWESVTARVHFRQGSAVLDTTYRDNGAMLRHLTGELNGMMSDGRIAVEAVTIETGASPEGDVQFNDRLAIDRARAIRSYLLDALPLNASQVRAWSAGVDWEGLTAYVRGSACPWRGEILEAVYGSGVRTSASKGATTECIRRLKGIAGGRAWEWLSENIFPELRQGAGTINVEYSVIDRQHIRDTMVVVHEYEGPDEKWYLEQASRLAAESSTRTVIESLEKKPRRYSLDSLYRVPVAALRTNLLVPAMNVGVEVPLSNRWSLSADWYFPWAWRSLTNRFFDPQSACLQILGGSLEGRLWLGVNHTDKDEYTKYRLRGHSLSLAAAGGYYDLQYDRTGRQGEFAALGIGYMYALPLGKGGVHLEFEVAGGYALSWYRGYEVHETGGDLIGNWNDGLWHGFVPVKAGVNLVVPFFGKDNR